MTVSTLSVAPEASASGAAPCAEPTREPTPARRRPRLLDLFCGAGGASAGYHAAGFDVIGVDITPQPDYPFPFVRADALGVDLAGFDVIAASPPCQRWSAATPPNRRGEHPDLIAPVRERLRKAVAAGVAWAYVIENVPGAPVLDPVTVCGDALRLGVRRHRLFESNLPLAGTPCWHDRSAPPVAVYGTYNQRRPGRQAASTSAARAAMGIDWMPWPALTQAIPPAYTHWLGVQLLAHAGRRGLVEGLASHDETRRRLSSPHTAGQPSHHQVPSVTTRDATNLVASVTCGATPPAGLRHCRCGTPLPARPTTGRWPRYCSHACRQAAYRLRRAGAS